MKKKLLIIIVIITTILCSRVKATTFKETDYLTGEFIHMSGNGITKDFTMRLMKDDKDTIAYCIEPFVQLNSTGKYTTYLGEISNFPYLTNEQAHQIGLISSYGYGYPGRTDIKWYTITQFLIWKTVDPTSSIYFTDTLKGNEIPKYQQEINELLEDTKEYDINVPIFKTYDVSYGDSLIFKDIPSNYKVHNVESLNYEYNNNTLVIKDITSSGKISFKKGNIQDFPSSLKWYGSQDNQNMLIPGTLFSIVYNMNINLTKGKVKLTLVPDNSIYTTESNIENTCYDLVSDNNIIDTACFNKDNLVYENNLPLGDYKLVEKSIGVGYKSSKEEITFSLTNKQPYYETNIYIPLIKNTIEINKKSCKDDICIPEPNAEFILLDKNNNIVETLITDEEGNTSIIVGYGKYQIKQTKGLEDYLFSPTYQEFINNEETPHKKELFNYYNNPTIEPPVEETPPDTGITINYYIITLISIITTVVTITLIRKLRT